jgi:hypothetical protein
MAAPDLVYIETIPKRGYRFAYDVADSDARIGPNPFSSTGTVAGNLRRCFYSDRSRFAPFSVLGESRLDNECLGFGMADAIIVRLGRLSGLTVMPTRTMLKVRRKTGRAAQRFRANMMYRHCWTGPSSEIGERIRLTGPTRRCCKRT